MSLGRVASTWDSVAGRDRSIGAEDRGRIPGARRSNTNTQRKIFSEPITYTVFTYAHEKGVTYVTPPSRPLVRARVDERATTDDDGGGSSRECRARG